MTRVLLAFVLSIAAAVTAQASYFDKKIECTLSEFYIGTERQSIEPFWVGFDRSEAMIRLPDGRLAVAQATKQSFDGGWSGLVQIPGYTGLISFDNSGAVAVTAHFVADDGAIQIMQGTGQCEVS